MIKIFGIISVLMLTISCEIDQLKPEDVEAAAAVWETQTETVDPASIIVPCTPVPNNIYFAGFNRNVSNVYVNHTDLNPIYFHAGYGLLVKITGSSDYQAYFKTAPQSGYYTGYSGSNIDNGQFALRVFYGGQYYYAANGSTLFVQDYADSAVFTWCDVDFEGTEFTFEQSKGKFTLHK